MRKSTPYPSKILELIARRASLILNVAPESDTDSPGERRKKRKNNDVAIKEFLEEFLNRVLPARDGKMFIAVFETGNL